MPIRGQSRKRMPALGRRKAARPVRPGGTKPRSVRPTRPMPTRPGVGARPIRPGGKPTPRPRPRKASTQVIDGVKRIPLPTRRKTMPLTNQQNRPVKPRITPRGTPTKPRKITSNNVKMGFRKKPAVRKAMAGRTRGAILRSKIRNRRKLK